MSQEGGVRLVHFDAEPKSVTAIVTPSAGRTLRVLQICMVATADNFVELRDGASYVIGRGHVVTVAPFVLQLALPRAPEGWVQDRPGPINLHTLAGGRVSGVVAVVEAEVQRTDLHEHEDQSKVAAAGGLVKMARGVTARVVNPGVGVPQPPHDLERELEQRERRR